MCLTLLSVPFDLPASLPPAPARTRLSEDIARGSFAMTITVVLIASFISLVYLSHANRIATRGYNIRTLEAERSAIITQFDIWNERVSKARSLAVIQDSLAAKALRPVETVEYVRLDR